MMLKKSMLITIPLSFLCVLLIPGLADTLVISYILFQDHILRFEAATFND